MATDYRNYDPVYARTEDEHIRSVLVYIDSTTLNIYKDTEFKDPLKKDEAIDLYKKGALIGALVVSGEITAYYRPFGLMDDTDYCTFIVGYTFDNSTLSAIVAYTDEHNS